MSTAVLSPSLTFKSWRNDGTPNASGTLYTYQAGTTTPIVTYTDSTAATTHTNPITLNARGETNLWLIPNTAYKFVEYDNSGTLIKVTDQVTQAQLLTLYGGTDTGVVNAYLLSYNAPYSAYQDGIAIYWTPAHTNTGPSTVNVSFNSGTTFTGVVAIVNQDGTALGAGELVANQLTFMMYIGGKFVVTNPFGGNTVLTVGGVNVTGSTIPADGIYLSAGNTLAFSSNTVQRMTVSPAGNFAMLSPSGGQTLSVAGIAGVVSCIIFESLNSINGFKNAATYEVGTFTGTLTGCTTSPTATFNWSRNGNAVTIDCPVLTATSNTTACTITGLPAALTPARAQWISVTNIEDGSVNGNNGSIHVTGTTLELALSTVVGARVTDSVSGFSNTNVKGIGGIITITYNLT